MGESSRLLEALPPEMLVGVLAKLECVDLLRVAATCKTLHGIVQDPRFDQR